MDRRDFLKRIAVGSVLLPLKNIEVIPETKKEFDHNQLYISPEGLEDVKNWTQHLVKDEKLISVILGR